MIAQKFRFSCDLCNSFLEQEKDTSPKGWVQITDNYTDQAGHTDTLRYDVCAECRTKIINAKGGAK